MTTETDRYTDPGGVEVTPETEGDRMAALVRRYADDLAAESDFDPETAAYCDGCGLDPIEHGEDGLTPVDDCPQFTRPEIPGDIADYLPDSPESISPEDWGDVIRAGYDEWRDSALENVLDIRGEVSIYGGRVELQTITAVLATGGPHVEVCFDDRGRGEVIGFGWWRANESRVPVDIGGHPLVDLFTYADDLIGGAYG